MFLRGLLPLAGCTLQHGWRVFYTLFSRKQPLREQENGMGRIVYSFSGPMVRVVAGT